MKIKSIYIDGLHNASNKTYQFGDIVYIFGNNGAGKSTILQAIQFALLGYIPGTAKNSKEALLRHSPKGYIDVRLVVSHLGEDVTIQRKVSSAGNKLTTMPDGFDIDSIISDIEVPIFNFNEFVGQTANKLKEYFIKNILPTSNGTIDWKAILSESIIDCNFQDREAMIEYGLSLIEDVDGNDSSALDQVIAANTKFKAEQSYIKSELQRLQNTVDSLIYYSDYMGPTDMSEINVRLLELGALRDQLIRYNSASSATQAAQDELARLKNDLVNLGGESEYDRLNLELPELKKRHSDLTESISTRTTALASIHASNVAADSIIESNGVCPYTKSICTSIAAKIEDLRAESEKRKADSALLSAEIEALNKEQLDLNAKIRTCESSISDFNTIRNRIITLQKTIIDLPQKPDTDKTVYDLDAEIEALNQNKMKLQANIQYNETIDNITKLKYDSELKAEALSAWVKKTDTNGLQTTLMVAPFDELAIAMTDYIQRMYNNSTLKAHFVVSSKSNSFSFGIIRDGVYIPYDLLSSGEKCLYTLALMICITNNSKSPLKLLLCDDMFDHLDSNVIESTFQILKSIHDIQFIFAGVKYCENALDVVMPV